MGLANRTALITGSSRGIGPTVAIRLVEEGSNVVVNYRTRKTEASEVVAIIENMGRKAVPYRGDVSNYNY